MKAKTLANKIAKAHYGKFPLRKNTCNCMEICVEEIGKMLYEQVTKHNWYLDLEAKNAIEVQLYKIGRALRAG